MKRFAARISIFILCGLLTTVLTSWASAYWLNPQNYTITSNDNNAWVKRVPSSWPRSCDPPTTIYHFSFAQCYWQTNRLYSLDHDFVLWDYRFGWPMNAMSYQITFHWNRVDGNVDQRMGWLADGIHLHRKSHPDWRLPLCPDPIPFVINTLVYSVFYLLLVGGLTVLLRLIKKRTRTRQGQCLKCGYDLAGLESCPECYTPSPQKAPVS